MKRFRKALLALAALMSLLIVGGLWLITSALNGVSDAVDSTLGDAHKVQTVAQRSLAEAGQRAQISAKAVLFRSEHSRDIHNKSVPTAASATKVSSPPADKGTSPLPQVAAKQKPKDEADSLVNYSSLSSLFFSDGDAPDLTSLLTSGDKEATNDKRGDTQSEEALTALIPGANSPTLQHWMAGKYKGKETQAVDDALEDPKIWRLVFFLNGGM